MTLDEIKAGISGLSADQRHELSIYLVHLELVDDTNYFETLRSRMKDQLDQSWEDLDELD